MGLFGWFSKKKTEENGADEDSGTERSSVQRKSRRIVTPGSKPAAPPAGTVARPGSAPKPSTKNIVKPSGSPESSRIQEARTEPKKTSDPLMIASGGTQPAASMQAPPRPKTKEPIVASKPLAFSGDLAGGTREGPCRTGDNALVEFLVAKAKLLDSDQAGQVRNASIKDAISIDAAAVRAGFLSEEQLVNALTQECWVPHLKVDKYEIRKKALDTITREDAMHYGVFPVDKLGSLLTMAMVNPLDTETIRVLESKTGLDIKKVVATRSEIMQGIEKYYSGLVQAKDTSIGFTQDAEPKSVTQMMSKAQSAAGSASSSQARAVAKAPSPPPRTDSVAAEIQDIDELLSSDEAIAPAILEPVSLSADDIEEVVEPAAEKPAEIDAMSIEPLSIQPMLDAEPEPVKEVPIRPPTQLYKKPIAPPAPPPPPAPAAKSPIPPPAPAKSPIPPPAPAKPTEKPAAKKPESDLIDVDLDISLPELEPDVKAPPKPEAKPAPSAKPAMPPIRTPAPTQAPLVETAPLVPNKPEVVKPAAKQPVEPPKAPSRPAAPAVPAPITPGKSSSGRSAVPGSSSSSGRTAAAATAGSSSRLGPPPQSGSSRIAAAQPDSKRFAAPAGPQPVNLIPVMEEEFQHAITHGRAHVFDKWIGLQTRNRIINGILIEDEIADVLNLGGRR